MSYSGDQSAVGNVMWLFCNDKCDVAKKKERKFDGDKWSNSK